MNFQASKLDVKYTSLFYNVLNIGYFVIVAENELPLTQNKNVPLSAKGVEALQALRSRATQVLTKDRQLNAMDGDTAKITWFVCTESE